jgi:hypothetical protein
MANMKVDDKQQAKFDILSLYGAMPPPQAMPQAPMQGMGMGMAPMQGMPGMQPMVCVVSRRARRRRARVMMVICARR